MTRSYYQIDIGTQHQDWYTITYDAGEPYIYVEPITEGTGRLIHEYEGARARAEVASIIKEFDRRHAAWSATPNPDQEPRMAVDGRHNPDKAKALMRSHVGLESAS